MSIKQGYKQTEIGEIPEEWKIEQIGNTCYKPQYGYTASASTEPIGPKFLRITDIKEGCVNWDEVPYCKCSESKIHEHILHKGDLLFEKLVFLFLFSVFLWLPSNPQTCELLDMLRFYQPQIFSFDSPIQQ